MKKEALQAITTCLASFFKQGFDVNNLPKNYKVKNPSLLFLLS